MLFILVSIILILNPEWTSVPSIMAKNRKNQKAKVKSDVSIPLSSFSDASYPASARSQLTTRNDRQRDLAGAAARASGREKGRRNNSFRGVRVEDKAQNDNLFAVAQPNPLFGNFYYPVTFHSYQNTSGNGTPGYVGYYILNQPCPAAPYPAQLAAWWNRDFQFFDRFAGLQQVS